MAKPKNGNGKSANKRSSKSKLRDATEAFEEALTEKALRRVKYILRLYVTGSSRRSLIAVYNLKKICEEYFPDEYDLEVIDIYKDPGAVREEQIIAAPTLVKRLPQPIRKFVGDMSNTQKILVGLDVYKRHDNQEGKRGS
ncbi:MAG TPA: circadian clock KaiB family protein [Pyrinomonadaceae bacterium]|jgi:circadian clock protein KaiB|nr:circadian clock KaiB family protein [Pyrinomonadaceae bacterium]